MKQELGRAQNDWADVGTSSWGTAHLSPPLLGQFGIKDLGIRKVHPQAGSCIVL